MTLRCAPTTEHAEQCALIERCTIEANRHPELALIHATPNGGKRDKVTAVMLKREGVKSGFPDLSLPVARKGWHGLYIEMKIAGGTVQPAQRWWHDQLRQQGYCVEVCYGYEAGWAAIAEYLGLEVPGL